MRILAIETATRVCSVALMEGEEIFERRTGERGTHSEKLFLFIEELLGEQSFEIGDLDAVLIGRGPGSYTGLRIGASAIKGLLYQTDLDLYEVNTLSGFAYSAAREQENPGTIHAVIDARRSHLYYQKFTFTPESLDALSGVDVVPIRKIEETIRKGDLLIGTGLNRLQDEVLDRSNPYDYRYITAKSLIGIYRDSRYHTFLNKTDPERYEPNYVTSGQVPE